MLGLTTISIVSLFATKGVIFPIGVLFGDKYTNHSESELFDDQLMLAESADRLFSVILDGAAHDKHEVTSTKSIAISPVKDEPLVYVKAKYTC